MEELRLDSRLNFPPSDYEGKASYDDILDYYFYVCKTEESLCENINNHNNMDQCFLRWHRLDGAARIWKRDPEYKEYYIYGIEYSKEQWFGALTEEQKLQALFNISEWG